MAPLSNHSNLLGWVSYEVTRSGLPTRRYGSRALEGNAGAARHTIASGCSLRETTAGEEELEEKEAYRALRETETCTARRRNTQLQSQRPPLHSRRSCSSGVARWWGRRRGASALTCSRLAEIPTRKRPAEASPKSFSQPGQPGQTRLSGSQGSQGRCAPLSRPEHGKMRVRGKYE